MENTIENIILNKTNFIKPNYIIEKTNNPNEIILKVPFQPLSEKENYDINYLMDINEEKIYRTLYSKKLEKYTKKYEIDDIELFPNSSFTKEEAYKKLENLLGISKNVGFIIDDNLSDFVLVNSLHNSFHNDIEIESKFSNINYISDIRGLLIDLKDEKLISMSYPSSDIIVCDDLKSNDDFIIANDIKFDKEELEIKKCFRGVLFRVSKYKNIVFHSTNKKIIPYRSKWNYSKMFLDIYYDANGPNDKELFGDVETSPFCYLFTLMDNTLNVSSRQNIQKTYIVHTYTYIMHEMNELKSWEGKHQDVGGLVENNCVYIAQNISLNEANDFLKNGYFENTSHLRDKRLRTGESIFIDDKKGNRYIIESTSFNWRKKLILNNHYSNFVILSQDSHKRFSNKLFKEKYILFKADKLNFKILYDLYNKNNFIIDIPIELYDEVPKNPIVRLKIIFLNFLIASPFETQPLVLNYYKSFVNDKKEVIQWIKNVYDRNGRDLNNNLYDPIKYKRLLQIINKIKESLNGTNDYYYLNKYHNKNDKIKSMIRNFINKEYGTSLYKLINQKDLEFI